MNYNFKETNYLPNNHIWSNNPPTSTASSNYSNITSFTPISSATTSDNEERLKIDLQIKQSQIESLENEIARLLEQRSATSSKQIPTNVDEIFKKLSTNYNKLTNELDETKQTLESLITAITLNPSNSITNNGRYDELEISHKILLKLQLLKNENEELLSQLSFGKSKEMEIEINLLKYENAKLKNQLNK